MQSRSALRDGFRKGDGPTLLSGHARFEGRAGRYFRLRVGRRTVQARQVVIDTGTRTRIPPIPGLSGLSYLDAENWLDVRSCRETSSSSAGDTRAWRWASSNAGWEAASPSSRTRGVLGKEDAEVSGALRAVPRVGGDRVSAEHAGPSRAAFGRAHHALVEHAGRKTSLQASHVFVATGRKPNTDDLGLETVGLKQHATVSSGQPPLGNPVGGIWAAGDVRGGPSSRIPPGTTTACCSRRSPAIAPAPPTASCVCDLYGPAAGPRRPDRKDARKGRRAVRLARFELERNGKAREIGSRRVHQGALRPPIGPDSRRPCSARKRPSGYLYVTREREASYRVIRTPSTSTRRLPKRPRARGRGPGYGRLSRAARGARISAPGKRNSAPAIPWTIVGAAAGNLGYFVHVANPGNGLIADNTRYGASSSIAAVGFALAAYPVRYGGGGSRASRPRNERFDAAFLRSQPAGTRARPTGHRGFYYHFLDMRTAGGAWCELSTMDSAISLRGR